MNNAPTLILQMQRMGDLIMTFPLMGYLQAREPNRPLWVVAEPHFFQELLKIAPKAVFFPPEAVDQLRTLTYHQIINLSHRPDAAILSASLSCQQRIGAYTQQNIRYINGFWQLYRSSIVHNNRHNLFHWADLNLLDCLETPSELIRMHHPLPSAPGYGCVGLFTGASETHKRPSPQLLGEIAKGLQRKGLKPLFLGGPEDKLLGAAAQNASGIAGSNLCGRFGLEELVALMHTLDLCICADTGPMHLAVWTGTPTLNLSMGPVNAWETGPTSPGHYVLRAKASCAGCWQCRHPQALCHQAFQASRIVLTAHTLIHAPQHLQRLDYSALELCKTDRDARGLYRLTSITGDRLTPRYALSRFWQEWFLVHSGSRLGSEVEQVGQTLATLYPRLFRHMQQQIILLSKHINTHLRHKQLVLPENFWQSSPPLLRPLSGYLQMSLQNEEYTTFAWDNALNALASCATTMKHVSR
ncbi:MAG: glycosyltransferase family 9 protein [Desulfovibrionaceae bacterium]